MPIFFLLVGILLIIVGINNKVKDLGQLVKDDFVPSGNSPGFIIWIVALFAIGSLGYIKDFKPVANAFLVLVVIGMLLSNKGFFAKFTSEFQR